MSIIGLIICLIIIGVLLWLVNAYIPMAQPIKTIINVLVILLVVLWLCNLFGVFDMGGGYRIGTGHTGHTHTLP
jgi:hypothetical protein